MQDFQDFQDDVFRSGTVFLCPVRDQAIANYRGVFGSGAVFLCPCRGGRRVSHKFGNPGNLVNLANPAQSSCVPVRVRKTIQGLRKTCISQVLSSWKSCESCKSCSVFGSVTVFVVSCSRSGERELQGLSQCIPGRRGLKPRIPTTALSLTSPSTFHRR